MNVFILAFLLCFVVTLIFGKFVIIGVKKLKASQNILHYVDNHTDKQGTPTMGGIMFILPIALITLIFNGFTNKLGLIAVAAMVCYGLVGFLDDFIKIKHKENLGLKAYQKIIAQGGIAIILTVFCYMNDFVGATINIPFTDYTLNLGWWYIPLCFLVFIATTNAVNLTDGLDGLAGSTSTASFAVFAIIGSLLYYRAVNDGNTLYAEEMRSLTIYVYAMLGGVLAFLWYNSHPATIFMGDTGSLALGGSLATVALFMKNPLLILFVGIIYVVTSISVIIQVIYFKLSKGKRILIMAPLHHHLQYKGYKESKIVAFYTIITIIAGGIALISI